ncbi:4984_t:CDS:1 [Gigaspora rosea]|nr:4984_t:CDS:1 [Gigaspora rosea]
MNNISYHPLLIAIQRFFFRAQCSYSNIGSSGTAKIIRNVFINQSSLLPSSFVPDEQMLYNEQHIASSFNSFFTSYPYKYDDYPSRGYLLWNYEAFIFFILPFHSRRIIARQLIIYL